METIMNFGRCGSTATDSRQRKSKKDASSSKLNEFKIEVTFEDGALEEYTIYAHSFREAAEMAEELAYSAIDVNYMNIYHIINN